MPAKTPWQTCQIHTLPSNETSVFNVLEKYYEHEPQPSSENTEHKVSEDFNNDADKIIST